MRMLGKVGKATTYSPEVGERFGGFGDHRCCAHKFLLPFPAEAYSSAFLAPTVDSKHLGSFLNSTDEEMPPQTD